MNTCLLVKLKKSNLDRVMTSPEVMTLRSIEVKSLT